MVLTWHLPLHPTGACSSKRPDKPNVLQIQVSGISNPDKTIPLVDAHPSSIDHGVQFSDAALILVSDTVDVVNDAYIYHPL